MVTQFEWSRITYLEVTIAIDTVMEVLGINNIDDRHKHACWWFFDAAQ